MIIMEDEDILTLVNHGSYKFISNDLTVKQEVDDYPVEDKSAGESNILPIRRLFPLMFFTGGLYFFYWFYKNLSYVKKSTPIFRTIGMFIPFVNWVIYYDFLKKISELIKSKDLESFNIPANWLLFFFVPIFGFWSMINIQESLNNYWRIATPNKKEKRSFTTEEKITMCIFIGIEIAYIVILLLLFVV